MIQNPWHLNVNVVGGFAQRRGTDFITAITEFDRKNPSAERPVPILWLRHDAASSDKAHREFNAQRACSTRIGIGSFEPCIR
jgi:hypothetical protein